MENAVATKYRGTGEYFLVFTELTLAAKYRGTITYQELAHVIGLPITGANMGTEIGHLLGEISEDQHRRSRPMLSAIAVDSNGRPGGGFFDLARRLGKLNGKTTVEEDRFWELEKEAVHETWRRKFGKLT